MCNQSKKVESVVICACCKTSEIVNTEWASYCPECDKIESETITMSWEEWEVLDPNKEPEERPKQPIKHNLGELFKSFNPNI